MSPEPIVSPGHVDYGRRVWPSFLEPKTTPSHAPATEMGIAQQTGSLHNPQPCTRNRNGSCPTNREPSSRHSHLQGHPQKGPPIQRNNNTPPEDLFLSSTWVLSLDSCNMCPHIMVQMILPVLVSMSPIWELQLRPFSAGCFSVATAGQEALNMPYVSPKPPYRSPENPRLRTPKL